MPITERLALLMTPDEVYAVAEVLGRVTVRQLRAMGLNPRERADVDRAHELLVELLQARLARDSRQLVLQLVNGWAAGELHVLKAGKTPEECPVLTETDPE